MLHIPTLTGCREAINDFMAHLPKLQTYLDQLHSLQADAPTMASQPLPMRSSRWAHVKLDTPTLKE
jgi:hypothetical protein